MEMDIITRYCMALECAEIFARYISGTSFLETRNKLLMRYGADYDKESREKLDSMFDELESIYTQTKYELPDNPDGMFFFKQYYNDNVFSSIGHIMLVNFLDIKASTVKEYMKSARKRVKELLNQPLHISDVVFSALVLEPSADGKSLRENLHKDIDNLKYDSEFKWKLFMALSEFDTYADRLQKLLESIEINLEKRLHKMDALSMELALLRRDSFDDMKIEELASSMNLPESNIRGKRVILCMLCMPCHQLIMDEQWNDAELPMFLGLAAEWGNRYPKESFDHGLLCDALRTIGEESKFEILLLLSKGAACAKEIAGNTGLDATTVSRHLTALMKYDLIRVDHKVGRNIYYRTNGDEIKNILILIRDAMC